MVYDNALRNGWQDWSWAAHDLAQTLVFQSAPKAISWEPDAVSGDWKGIYFHSDTGAADPAVADFTAVRFWINGAGGGQAVRLAIYQNNAEVGSKDLTPLPAGWTQMTVTWAELGVTAPAFDGIIFQTNAQRGSGGPPMSTTSSWSRPPAVPPPGGPVTVAVDPNLDRRAINPLIYGVNWADADAARHRPLHRQPARRQRHDALQLALRHLEPRLRLLLPQHQRGTDQWRGGRQLRHSTLAAGAEVVMTMPIDQVAKSAARLPASRSPSTAHRPPPSAPEPRRAGLREQRQRRMQSQRELHDVRRGPLLHPRRRSRLIACATSPATTRRTPRWRSTSTPTWGTSPAIW